MPPYLHSHILSCLILIPGHHHYHRRHCHCCRPFAATTAVATVPGRSTRWRGRGVPAVATVAAITAGNDLHTVVAVSTDGSANTAGTGRTPNTTAPAQR